MSEVNMLVRITAKEQHIERLKEAMVVVQEITRTEPGVLRYQFYQDRKSPESFYVQETYADKDAFRLHGNSSHMAEFLATTADLVTGVDMHKVDPLA